MKYISKHQQILQKIKKYRNALSKSYEKIKDLPEKDLDINDSAAATTQYITAISELAKLIENEEIEEKIAYLVKGRVQRTRNIAAHDYYSINWTLVKDVCRNILDKVTDKVIDQCIEIAEKECNDIKDYTEL